MHDTREKQPTTTLDEKDRKTDVGSVRADASGHRPDDEPEVPPASLAGNWLAWSADGLRIVAAAKTIEEVERLAAEAGELEPILDQHSGTGRQL